MADTKEKEATQSGLDRYFRITARGSSLGQELRGGLTTFFTMAYIVVLNPLILGYVPDKDGNFLGGGTEPNVVAIAAATALIAGLMTLAMGSLAKFPIAIAAGLGLNAYVAFGLVGGGLFTWPEAMGLIIIEGVLVLILVLTKARIKFLYAVPLALKKAIAAGIGLFLAYIAFWDAKVVLDDPSGATPGSFGFSGGLNSWPTVVFIFGILLGGILLARKVKGALLITIAASTVLAFIIEAIISVGRYSAENLRGWSLVVPTFSGMEWDLVPDFSTLGDFSILGPFTHGPAIITVLLIIFSLLVVDFFDTLGTMTAVGEEAELNDEDGIPEDSQAILIVDSVAAIAGGAGGVSSNTSYIESASGVGDGARTGLASVTTGIALLLVVFLAPLAQIVPFEAATPVLVLVGLMMLRSAITIDWQDYRIAVPAFLTMIVMPFGYSIAAGIGLGFIAYVVINAFTGNVKAIKPLMWVGAAAFVVYFSTVGLNTLIN